MVIASSAYIYACKKQKNSEGKIVKERERKVKKKKLCGCNPLWFFVSSFMMYLSLFINSFLNSPLYRNAIVRKEVHLSMLIIFIFQDVRVINF